MTFLAALSVPMLGLLGACSSDPAKEVIRDASVQNIAGPTWPLGLSKSGSSTGEVIVSDSSIAEPVYPTAPTVDAKKQSNHPSARETPASSPFPSLADTASLAGRRLVTAARSQVGITTGYDPAYVRLDFPGGDVDPKTGVCSDVVVRALRVLGIDLQERVNLDMKAHFSEYPTKWGLASPDPNIDHRRVPNLARYFARRGYEKPVTSDPADYEPGDVVWIKLPLDHIGIVSDRMVGQRPMLIHNVGQGAQEEDVLFSWTVVGHYRVVS
jgi:uncharacterized protein